MANPFTIPVGAGPVAVRTDRIAAAVTLPAAVAVVAVLAGATPDERGHGTHEDFGMAPRDWPKVYGMPCPTCGCTTAACQLVHGDVFGAFATQPFGAALALAGILLGAHAAYCLVRGRSFADLLVRLPLWRVLFGAVVLLLGWF